MSSVWHDWQGRAWSDDLTERYSALDETSSVDASFHERFGRTDDVYEDPRDLA